MLVNERFVKNRLDGRSPLGQIVRVPRLRRPPFALSDDAFQIVGVVRDTFNQGLANPVIPEVYLPSPSPALATSSWFGRREIRRRLRVRS